MLIRQSADELQRVSMELGGNAPFIVFADADVDAAVDGAMIAKMRNMGEACTAANRFLVHADVAEEFAEKLGARMGALVVGRGQDDGVDVGPLIDQNAVDSVSQLVTDAVHDGARVVDRRQAPTATGPGYFYPPTVLVDVPAEAEIVRQEIFGPVAPITTFTDEDEAIRQANDTEYGLASYVYTRDLARTIRVAESLQFGMVGINSGLLSNPAAPFGGVKASGFGREGSFEGIEEYLDTTYVALPRRLSVLGDLRGHRDGLPRLRARGRRLAVLRGVGQRRGRATPRCWPGCRRCPERKRQANLVFAAARWHGVPAPGSVRRPARRPARGRRAPSAPRSSSGRRRPTRSAGWPACTPRSRGSRRTSRAARSRCSRSGPAPGCASTPTVPVRWTPDGCTRRPTGPAAHVRGDRRRCRVRRSSGAPASTCRPST